MKRNYFKIYKRCQGHYEYIFDIQYIRELLWLSKRAEIVRYVRIGLLA